MLAKPIAMLLENIPASEEPFDGAQDRRGEPAHQHMDFLFVARLLDESQRVTLDEAEGREIRWFTREEVERIPAEEIFANVKAYILKLLS